MEYPTVSIKIGYGGKDIVQGFIINCWRIMYFIWLLFTLFTYTIFFYPYYYSPIHYITYLLCVFKRFYSKIPESRRGLVED